MNLSDVIESLVEERGIERDKVIDIVCDGIRMAYEKKYPTAHFSVSFNKKTGSLDVFIEKKVVTLVGNELSEISSRRAKAINPVVEIDSMIQVPFEEPVGRIEILAAKQIIASKIRELEQSGIFDEFKSKRGTILNGVVHKKEQSGYAVKIGEILALLPANAIIPGESIKIGHAIKVLLEDVTAVARGDYQLFLNRVSVDFIKQLLVIEIPEIFEGLVEIKKIVRIPGYKTKVCVTSTRKEIDPVGTCVGVGGARIKPILREIGQEKIDLVEWSDSIEKMVRVSLKPAEIDKVEFVNDDKVIVSLAQDQRSFAIGKLGQNINLASKLVGLDIQLQDIVVTRSQADMNPFDDSPLNEDLDQNDEY